MRYCSGRVGVQWNGDCNVGEMRVVRGDWGVGTAFMGASLLTGRRIMRLGIAILFSVWGLRRHGFCEVAIARNGRGENVGNNLGGGNRVAANWK